jgi:hypothetical protein
MGDNPIAAFLAEYPHSPHDVGRRDSIQRRRVSISARQFQHILEIVYVHYWLNRTVDYDDHIGLMDDDHLYRWTSSSQSSGSGSDNIANWTWDGNRIPTQHAESSPSSSEHSPTYQEQLAIARAILNNEA